MTFRHIARTLAVLLICFSGLRGIALAEPTYTLTDLGVLPGFSASVATAINAQGQVVGNLYPEADAEEAMAFFWDSHTGMRPLGTLGGRSSWATDINNNGQVVGYSLLKDNQTIHAFLWDPIHGIRDLGTLGGERSWANAINDLGQVVGASDLRPGNRTLYRAFLWKAGQTMQSLGWLGGQYGMVGNSSAKDINHKGQVVGVSDTMVEGNMVQHAFYWETPQGLTDLGTLGGYNSEAVAINAVGRVVGNAETSDGAGYVAFAWEAGMGMTALLPGTTTSYLANALNDGGAVVGDSETDVFLFQQGQPFGLSASLLPAAGWILNTTNALNSRGQIVGMGQSQGQNHAVLLTPMRRLSGQIILAGTLAAVQSVTLEFRGGDGTPSFTQSVLLAADGTFAMEGLPAGCYQVAVKGPQWLQRVLSLDTTSGNVTDFTTTLLGGDANNDNRVDVYDLATLAESFNTTPADPDWNPAADFNGDGYVDVYDLALLAENFNTAGDL